MKEQRRGTGCLHIRFGWSNRKVYR